MDKKYYFMVFLSIIDLLDCIGAFYKINKNKIRFYCADSSFYIDLNRLVDGKISVKVLDIPVGIYDEMKFIIKLYEACNNFYEIYKDKFEEKNCILKDIKSAMDSLLPILV